MNSESQREFLLGQANYADSQAVMVQDPQVRHSWTRIAQSCRHLADLYLSVNGQEASPTSKPEPVPLVCPDCSNLGAVVWDEAQGQKRLVSVHGEFHAETGRTRTRETLIVCNTCDTIQD